MEAVGWMSTTGWLLLTVVTLYMTLYSQSTRRHYQTIKRMGLEGPRPTFFIGNMAEMTSKGFHACFKDWEQLYGKVYGIYRAKTPSVVVHDPDLLCDILVKKFAAFPNRQSNRVTDMKPWNTMLQFLRDDRWRHVRNTLSPSFSSGKLKTMVPVVQRCCRNLVKSVTQKAESGEEVDTKVLANAFSMDVTAGSGFGMEVNCLLDPSETFGIIAKRILYPPQWMFTVLCEFWQSHLAFFDRRASGQHQPRNR